MKSTDYSLIRDTAAKQEELLRFDHFTNRDALELGNHIANAVYERGIDLAICIRKLSGSILFQHLTEGTNGNNENWMRRKFNTVRLMERSSLAAWADAQEKGEAISGMGLSDLDYVLCGGGFPIRLKSGELVGVIIVSNLPHEQDHQLLVELTADFLGVRDVPEIVFD